jgi:hypothetical protein
MGDAVVDVGGDGGAGRARRSGKKSRVKTLLSSAVLLWAIGCGSLSHPTPQRRLPRHPGDPDLPTTPVCNAAVGGSSGPVRVPTLRTTLPGSWDENWLASPAVYDIDGDGKKEIIAARHSVLYVWRGQGTPLWTTGTLLWSAPFTRPRSTPGTIEHGTTRMWPSPVVGNLDGDGVEIAVAGGIDEDTGANLAVYDSSGALRPGWPKRFGDTEARAIAGADIDGDGVIEILVNKTDSGPVTAVFEPDGTLHLGWPQVGAGCTGCEDFGGYNQNIGAGDLDGDGVLDVVSTYDMIGFGAFHGDGSPFPTAAGFSRRYVAAVPAYHDLAFALQGWGEGDRSEFTDSPPVVADIDGDGQMEIVLAGDHETSWSTTNLGVSVWVLEPDLTRLDGWLWPRNSDLPLQYGDDGLGPNIVDTTPSPSVANLDGNPGLEILVPAYDGLLYAFRPDGTVMWDYEFAKPGEPFAGASEALVADLNGDGAPEIIFTTYTSGSPGLPDRPAHLVILNENGAELQRVEIAGRGSMAAPTIADVDGDGKLELVISLKDSPGGGLSGVQIWDLPGSSTNCVLWGTGRGGWLRQGYLPK